MCFLGEACEGITWFEFKFRDSSFPGGRTWYRIYLDT